MQKISSFHQFIYIYIYIYIYQILESRSKETASIFDHNFLKTSNKHDKHDWTSIKYLNDLHHNRTQKQLQYFFLIYCRNIANFLFQILWTCQAISIKNDYANFYKLWYLSACKKWTPFLTSFLRYCKLVNWTTLRMLHHAHQ